MAKSGRGKRALKVLLGVVAIAALALVVTFFVVDEPRPEGRQGPDREASAEALTARVEAAVDVDAWARTGAVAWTFGGRHEHLWDRTRDLARVRWDDTEALLDLSDPERGIASRGGRVLDADGLDADGLDADVLDGDEAREVLEQAYAFWINDAFWLNPLAKLRDEGVRREVVTLDEGGEGLLVTYGSGGLTPGDAYLWILDANGRPRAWRMWVSIVPVGGIETSWEGWQRLETGAWISTEHEGPLGLDLELTEVRGAATIDALVEGPDPFAALAR